MNSFHPNLHYYNVGLHKEKGKTYTTTGDDEFISVNTLENFIHENEDIGKTITYLKIDIEGTEFFCFENWFQTDVFKNVDQFGLEIHIHPMFYNFFNVNVQKWFEKLHAYILKLGSLYGLYLVETEPNLCVGKPDFHKNMYYPYNDLLFVK